MMIVLVLVLPAAARSTEVNKTGHWREGLTRRDLEAYREIALAEHRQRTTPCCGHVLSALEGDMKLTRPPTRAASRVEIMMTALYAISSTLNLKQPRELERCRLKEKEERRC